MYNVVKYVLPFDKTDINFHSCPCQSTTNYRSCLLGIHVVCSIKPFRWSGLLVDLVDNKSSITSKPLVKIKLSIHFLVLFPNY